MTFIKSLTCPTCGAPLQVSANQTEFTCQYCGNVVRVEPSKSTNPPPPVIVQPRIIINQSQPGSAAYQMPRNLALYRLIVMLIPSVIIIGAVVTVTMFGGNPMALLNAITGHGASVAAAFGGKGTGPGLWDRGQYMAVDGKGYVYVIDIKDNRVQRFDGNGKYLSYWDVAATSDAPPNCLTADRVGDVYVCLAGNLLKYDGATGKRLATLVGPVQNFILPNFKAAAPTLDGGVIAMVDTLTDGDTLLKFDAQGNTIATYPKLIANQMPLHSTLETVDGAAVDGLSNLYFLDTVSDMDGFSHSVLSYSADGRFISRFGSAGRGPDQFDLPTSIAVDSQSRIYIGDRGQIKVFDQSGRFLTNYTVPGMVYAVYAMAFAPDGSLYALCMDNADNEQTQVFKLQIADLNAGKAN